MTVTALAHLLVIGNTLLFELQPKIFHFRLVAENENFRLCIVRLNFYYLLSRRGTQSLAKVVAGVSWEKRAE